MKTTKPAISEYDQQAENFLTSNGIKFRATLSDTKAPAWGDGGRHGHHYRVTLSKGNGKPDGIRNFGAPKMVNKLVFDFWDSLQASEDGVQTIKPYGVLSCISGETYTPATFAEWCSECGDSADSIKALQTYRRCAAFAKRLRAFFTEAELKQLQEIQ